jgi:hypothetical protein
MRSRTMTTVRPSDGGPTRDSQAWTEAIPYDQKIKRRHPNTFSFNDIHTYLRFTQHLHVEILYGLHGQYDYNYNKFTHGFLELLHK